MTSLGSYIVATYRYVEIVIVATQRLHHSNEKLYAPLTATGKSTIGEFPEIKFKQNESQNLIPYNQIHFEIQTK